MCIRDREERAARRKQITITASLFQGSAAFDPRWTGEALGNVVNNAVKYTPAGGTVSISAQMLDSFCRIDVADTGPGIPESEQAEVFNRDVYKRQLPYCTTGQRASATIPTSRIWHRRSFCHSPLMIFHMIHTSFFSAALSFIDKSN